MGLTVYNTLTRRKQPFKPVTPGKVGIYLCGPTVYKPSHLGHAVGPIIFDAIKRYLVFRGFEVTWVVNITDVDDKLIVEAASQKTTTMQLAKRVTKDYLDAMTTLHVDGIDLMPKASEHIGDIIDIINNLIEKDIAYPSGGDVYFDVTRHADYGKLSNRSVEDQEGQRELQSGEKRNPGDFALWKKAKPEEPDEVKFDSPWGKGRPGWHIECSAMAMRYLGDTFDIHGGGMDLIFPHHENEIAQSEGATGRPFANVWMHNGLTRFNTKKISKSDPKMQAILNKMTLHNLLAEYTGEHIRFFVLSTHYRRPIEYSADELESKRKGLHTFYRLFERVERICDASPYANAPEPVCEPQASARATAQSRDREGADGMVRTDSPEPQASACANAPDDTDAPARISFRCPEIASESLSATCDEHASRFVGAMEDDFNTAGGIASLFDLASAINRFIEENKLESCGTDGAKSDVLLATRRLVAVGRLIGLFLDPPAQKGADDDGLADQVMQVLIEVRQLVRQKKDFETADLIRNRLADCKITLEDRPDGTVWRRD